MEAEAELEMEAPAEAVSTKPCALAARASPAA